MNAVPAKFDFAADSPEPVTISRPVAGHCAASVVIAVGAAFDALATKVVPAAKPPGPEDITSATALPDAADAPAAGFCEITLPASTVADSCCVNVPTTNPAPVIAELAAACV